MVTFRSSMRAWLSLYGPIPGWGVTAKSWTQHDFVGLAPGVLSRAGMTELADTPNLASFYCPGCSPERDPLGEILTVRWCDAHEPRSGGFDDERAKVSKDILTSTGEAESVTNRAWCEVVHRRAKRA